MERGRAPLRATQDGLDDVVLVPMEDEADYDVDEFMPEPLPDIEVPLSERLKTGIDAPDAAAMKESLANEQGKTATEALNAAASRLLSAGDGAPKEGATASKPLGKKRWLVGRGSAKRRKLEENAALKDWLVANGVWVSETADWGRSSSGVSMAIETRESNENEISGRGLIAARDINLYEELARVPVDLTMTKAASRRKFGEDIIIDSMSDHSAIALHLLSEKFQEKDSFWQPYLAVIPQDVDEIGASYAWADSELNLLLEGSPLLNTSLFLQGRIHEEYDLLKESVFTKYPEKFPLDIFTYDNYLWAYGILLSRAVRLGKTDDPDMFIALVPYVDLINHNSFSDTYIDVLEEGQDLPLGLTTKEKFIVVQADKFYTQFEQIYISYGPKSNGQLLLLYGFCLERNQQDFLEVTVSHLFDEVPLAEEKKKILDKRKLQRVAFPLYRDRFTNDMLAFLRFVLVEPEDLALALPDESEDKGSEQMSMEQKIITALESVDPTKPGAELSERRALDRLKRLCEELLTGYPTSLEDDEVLLQDRSMFELLPKNQRNAVRVRLGEKLILRATITTVDRVLNNLESQFTEMDNRERRRDAEAENTWWGRLGFEYKPAIKATNLEELLKEMDI